MSKSLSFESKVSQISLHNHLGPTCLILPYLTNQMESTYLLYLIGSQFEENQMCQFHKNPTSSWILKSLCQKPQGLD